MGRRQRSEKVESRSSLGASAAGFRSMTAEEGRKVNAEEEEIAACCG